MCVSIESLGLSKRQGECLILIAEGLTNKQIARVLGIAEGSVKVHVAALFRRYHVANRTALAAQTAALPAVAFSHTAHGESRSWN